jgi:hypothetical protein
LCAKQQPQTKLQLTTAHIKCINTQLLLLLLLLLPSTGAGAAVGAAAAAAAAASLRLAMMTHGWELCLWTGGMTFTL